MNLFAQRVMLEWILAGSGFDIYVKVKPVDASEVLTWVVFSTHHTAPKCLTYIIRETWESYILGHFSWIVNKTP